MLLKCQTYSYMCHQLLRQLKLNNKLRIKKRQRAFSERAYHEAEFKRDFSDRKLPQLLF